MAKQSRLKPAERQARERIAAHARKAMMDGRHPSIAAYAKQLELSAVTVLQVLNGDRTPGLDVALALHRKAGIDMNDMIDTDPPRRWFKPLVRRVSFDVG